VSADEFFAAVRSAALKSRRQFAELRTSGHTPDHPATFKEAAYLKAIFIELS
jgi:23S rRNA (cytosine1962-C5)-methyltransferase